MFTWRAWRLGTFSTASAGWWDSCTEAAASLGCVAKCSVCSLHRLGGSEVKTSASRATGLGSIPGDGDGGDDADDEEEDENANTMPYQIRPLRSSPVAT